jgi:hypothetical protein
LAKWNPSLGYLEAFKEAVDEIRSTPPEQREKLLTDWEAIQQRAEELDERMGITEFQRKGDSEDDRLRLEKQRSALSDRRQADSGGVDTDTSKPTGAVRNRRAGAGSKHGQHRKTKVRSENRKLSDTPKIIPNKIPDDW